MIINITFDPIIGQIGPVAISYQGVCTALGLVFGVWLAIRTAARLGVPVAACARLALPVLVGGVLFGRVASVLTHWLYYAANPGDAIAVWDGGMSVYGALLGGTLVLWLAARHAGMPAWALLDAATPGALLGVAMGRTGCLLTGSAWGSPTGSAWGIIYWNPHDLLPPSLMSVPLHPYPLYEAAGVLLVLACPQLAYRKFSLVAGSTFLVASVGYSIVRFVLAGFRAAPELAARLQAVQWLALAIGISSYLLLLMRSKTSVEERAVPQGDYHYATGDEHAA